MIKSRSVMLALVKNVRALEAPLATVAPRPHISYHLSRTHPTHTKGLENMTLPLRMVLNPLVQELLKNFLELMGYPDIQSDSDLDHEPPDLDMKMLSFWTPMYGAIP